MRDWYFERCMIEHYFPGIGDAYDLPLDEFNARRDAALFLRGHDTISIDASIDETMARMLEERNKSKSWLKT